MGRKIEIKKAKGVAVCSDVDVTFTAFSPSASDSKFTNLKKIEDLRNRYVNLPENKIRLKHEWHVQQQLVEKLNNLSHINGESSKLHYIDMQDPVSARRGRPIEVKLRQPIKAQNEPQRGQPDPETSAQEIDS